MRRDKVNDLNIIKQAAKLYEQNLLDKNMLFVYLRNNNVEYYEVTFLEEHFKHLTGVNTNLNAYQFFYKAKNNRLKVSEFDYKNSTTVLKLDNLIKSMSLSSYAKMIGEFRHNKVYLSIERIAIAVMSKNTKENLYNKLNYISKNTTMNRMMKNNKLLKIIDIDKLH